MEKIAFTMHLKPGVVAEYEKRHDEIWPELVDALKSAGIADYSIFVAPDERTLLAVLWRHEPHGMDDLPHLPVMQRWWAFMADLMDTHADNVPVTVPLRRVFHLG